MAARLALSLGLVVAVLATSFGSEAAPKKPKKPTSAPAPAPKDDAAAFDKAAASNALSSVGLDKCKTTNAKRGDGHVMVKFEPAGAVVEATVDRGPMAGTPVATCIAKAFKKAKVPAFVGEPVVVGKSFKFE